uniref:Collectrin-like domain-containing protein n=1 Tax=Ciona savignyi TaxID=51511 RepID=H2Z8K0_CIOSA
MRGFLSLLVLLSACLTLCRCLTCTSPKMKITIKITDPTEFDKAEQYLFTGVMAYSFRKYCTTFSDSRCTEFLKTTIDTVDVQITDVTERFAMCVQVTNQDPNFIEDVVRATKPRFNGALVLTDETLLFEGIPPTLKPEFIPDFPTWLIPFIVFVCLVIMAAIAILSYDAYQSKKQKKKMVETDSDNESHIYETYENGGAVSGSVTML